MSKHHRKTSRDANHYEVTGALAAIGCRTIDLAMVGSDVPDILAANRKDTVLFEIKTPEGSFDIGQLRFLASYPNYSAFCQSGEEAIKIMRQPALYALSEKDKARILRIVARYEREYDQKRRDTGKKTERIRIKVEQFEADFASEI
jgi:hypothetical protein